MSGNGKGDHFPLPLNCGGTDRVDCCQSCHDMKDRFGLAQWPAEWITAVLQDMPKVSRETRLFLAKAIRLLAERVKEDEVSR